MGNAMDQVLLRLGFNLDIAMGWILSSRLRWLLVHCQVYINHNVVLCYCSLLNREKEDDRRLWKKNITDIDKKGRNNQLVQICACMIKDVAKRLTHDGGGKQATGVITKTSINARTAINKTAPQSCDVCPLHPSTGLDIGKGGKAPFGAVSMIIIDDVFLLRLNPASPLRCSFCSCNCISSNGDNDPSPPPIEVDLASGGGVAGNGRDVNASAGGALLRGSNRRRSCSEEVEYAGEVGGERRSGDIRSELVELGEAGNGGSDVKERDVKRFGLLILFLLLLR